MRKIVSVLAGLAVVAVLSAKPAEAQQFGAHVSWGDDTDFGLGARLGFPLGQSLKSKGITALATFDYFFPDGFNLWELTANGIYNITPTGSVSPYVGGGLSFASSSADNTLCPTGSVCDDFSRFGLNLLGGLKFKPLGNVVPFVEARFAVRDRSQLVLSGGVLFGKP